MAQCAQCMYENEPGAAACEQCGADLTMEVLSLQLGEVCRSCDSYNDPGVRVCVSCGKPLGTDSTTLDEEDAEQTTPSSGPDSRPWMAPPDTGEYSATAKKPPERTPAPPSAEPTSPIAPPLAAARQASALPPGALPPGWMTGGTKPTVSVQRGPKETKVTCPKCRAENLPSARYCGTCGTGLLPNAATQARGKLILIRGLSGEGRQFPLPGTPTPAGRTEGPVTFPEDPYISGHHATFSFRGNDLVIRDEGAANGVYVRLREAHPLRPGDMFNVGERLLRYAGTMAIPAATTSRHGSPRTSDRLQVLEEVLEGGGIGRVCKRAGPVITIGRASCDLNFPSDGFVSARHAELSLAGETAFLRDLGSANGTFIRVQPRTERVLAHGDYLMMGRELLRVELTSHAA